TPALQAGGRRFDPGHVHQSFFLSMNCRTSSRLSAPASEAGASCVSDELGVILRIHPIQQSKLTTEYRSCPWAAAPAYRFESLPQTAIGCCRFPMKAVVYRQRGS